MAQCPYRESCAFMRDEMFCKMRGLIQRFQQTYCQDNFSACARYKVASVLGEAYVPQPMIPSQGDWAAQIIEDQKAASVQDKT